MWCLIMHKDNFTFTFSIIAEADIPVFSHFANSVTDIVN
jgi:hypothetical protein